MITGNCVPDQATVARFIARHQESLAELFGSVLKLCAKAGLVASGVIAVDGTKLSASAASDSNVDDDRIAREIIAEAIATDEAEDEQHGDARGDELPPELQTEAGRRGGPRASSRGYVMRRPRRAAERSSPRASRWTGLTLSGSSLGHRAGWDGCASGRQQDRKRWQTAAPIPRSRAERLRPAALWLEDDLAAEERGNAAYEAFREHRRLHHPRRLGGTPKPYSPPEIPQGEVNVTDPDSRRMMGNRRYIQGYNAQAVVNEQQIVLAAEITADAGDFSHLGPMITAALRSLRTPGSPTRPRWRSRTRSTGTSSTWTTSSLSTGSKSDPTGLRQTQGERPGWTGGRDPFMRRVLGPISAARPTENARN